MDGIRMGLFSKLFKKKNAVAAQNVQAEVTSPECKKLLAFKKQIVC